MLCLLSECAHDSPTPFIAVTLILIHRTFVHLRWGIDHLGGTQNWQRI